jgi:hypothetical protein
MGDLNFDMLNDKKCQALKDLCDVLDFSQLVLKPTCFMKNCMEKSLSHIDGGL